MNIRNDGMNIKNNNAYIKFVNERIDRYNSKMSINSNISGSAWSELALFLNEKINILSNNMRDKLTRYVNIHRCAGIDEKEKNKICMFSWVVEVLDKINKLLLSTPGASIKLIINGIDDTSINLPELDIDHFLERLKRINVSRKK